MTSSELAQVIDEMSDEKGEFQKLSLTYQKMMEFEEVRG